MTELVIACEMMEDEIREAMRQSGRELPVVWVDRGLHEWPERLREDLRIRIGGAEADTLLLTFSCCGGALYGLCSERATMVVPRFDDCIRLLKSTAPGRGGVDCRTLYFTGGWLESERFIHKEYQACRERRGSERARRVYDILLKNYRTIELVDTGSYDLNAYREQAQSAAEELNLAFCTGEGSVRVLKKLFSREWDEEFLVLPPGTPITMEHFLYAERGREEGLPCPAGQPPANESKEENT